MSCRELVKAGAPNTKQMLDPVSGNMKPLEIVLMADGWEANPAAAAACKVRMDELGIVPYGPGGGSHGVSDSCHPWPPQESDRILAAKYSKVSREALTGGPSIAENGAQASGIVQAMGMHGSCRVPSPLPGTFSLAIPIRRPLGLPPMLPRTSALRQGICFGPYRRIKI